MSISRFAALCTGAAMLAQACFGAASAYAAEDTIKIGVMHSLLKSAKPTTR